MAKLSKHNVPFGIVPNELLNSKKISLKAKGLFAYMQSKPNGWKFSAKMIASKVKESVDAVSSGLKELEEIGYLVRIKKQTSSGFCVEYILHFEKPIQENPILENPILENPILENPIIGKSINNIKKELSKKELNKKEEIRSALEFLQINFTSQYEILLMHYKSQINDFVKFSEMFEATVQQERLEFDFNVLAGRFKKFARNWIDNQNRYDTPRVVSIVTETKQKIQSI